MGSLAALTTQEQGMHLIPTFVLGCDSAGIKNKKKTSRKMVLGNKLKQSMIGRGPNKGKRKGGSDVGRRMDGDDVDMDGVCVNEKRLKVIDDVDGADMLSTVAEVNVVQPREEQ